VVVSGDCGHVLCEACLARAFARSARCPQCGQPTGGTYRTPRQLRRRAEALRRKANTTTDDDHDDQPKDTRLTRRDMVP
jgi:ribosomal protein L34E